MSPDWHVQESRNYSHQKRASVVHAGRVAEHPSGCLNNISKIGIWLKRQRGCLMLKNRHIWVPTQIKAKFSEVCEIVCITWHLWNKHILCSYVTPFTQLSMFWLSPYHDALPTCHDYILALTMCPMNGTKYNGNMHLTLPCSYHSDFQWKSKI